MLLQIIFLVAITLIAVPVSVLALQVLFALAYKKNPLKLSSKKTPHFAILMPAHNESLVIAETIKTLLSAIDSADQILVVADNCNDETASIARNLGATVIERQHSTLRGKGYALDYGLQYLRASPPDVVIVIDADCKVDAGSISTLTNACVVYQRPIQALYLMHPELNPSLKQRIAAFAWVVKNHVRPLGFKVLGLPCQLMGTGMAFLWQDITAVNLASGHIAEDMKLGVDLARLNKAPIFVPEALVTSVFPTDKNATKTQRARWEHGHLSIIVSDAPSLFFEAIKTKNLQMLGLAFDLIVPPLAVLALMSCLVSLIGLVLHQFLHNQLLLIYTSATLIVLIVTILIAWAFFGRHIVSFKQLCYAPIYALVKIPLYIKFFVNRQVEWVRSKRD
ncbi:MAG: glycosyl transferase [Methylotenera sp.]|nr:MAG: glycosyl transferase [Methylotenera sp.]